VTPQGRHNDVRLLDKAVIAKDLACCLSESKRSKF